jgi:uncharacterized membrane protein YgcG
VFVLCIAQSNLEEKFMISAIGFLVAVSAVSAILFALMMRADRGGRSKLRNGASDDGGLSSAGDSWSFATWVGYSSEVSSSLTDNACSTGSFDSGSFDSGGGGGDCGGGGSSD